MEKKPLLIIGLLFCCQTAWAQGHCARVSTEVTFRFGMETLLPQEPNGPVAVDLYHTDLELSFRSGGWEIVVAHDCPGCGAAGLDLLPEEALLMGNPDSVWLLSSIPPAFEFIGARPGEPFWVLPQNAGTGALPLGIAVERADSARLCAWNPGDPRGADTEDRWFELRLLDVRGPADANFAMWQADAFGPPAVFVSTHEGGIDSSDVFYLADGSHVHMNWGFTQPGLYEVDFRVATLLRCAEELTADWAPLGDGFFSGDCRVDALDFAHLAAHWLRTPAADDPNTWMFADPNDPVDSISTDTLLLLADQWLECGYPGCR